MCRSRKYPYPLQERIREILKFFKQLKESMKLNWNFHGGGRRGR